MIHRSTYPNPSPHTQSHTHTQTQTIKPSTEPYTKTFKPIGANNGHHTHHPSHRLANPSHLSETHAIDLKPIRFETHRSKPIKKNHHWSHHRSYQWSTQPINKSTISNPPSTNPSPPIQTQLAGPTSKIQNLAPMRDKERKWEWWETERGGESQNEGGRE